METLTTEVSRTSMNVASMTEMVTIQGFTNGRESAVLIRVCLRNCRLDFPGVLVCDAEHDSSILFQQFELQLNEASGEASGGSSAGGS